MEEGVSLYLYRISPAGEIRNYPPRVAPDGHRYRQVLPINLHYLLSSWAREAAKQQRLLGWAMRLLEDTPILPAGLLNQGGPEADTFRPNETVDVTMETISIYDMGAIWDVAKPNTQPSVCYVARMIGVESQIEMQPAHRFRPAYFAMARWSSHEFPSVGVGTAHIDGAFRGEVLGRCDGAPAEPGLSVIGYPNRFPELRVSATEGPSGIYSFSGLPGLRDAENGGGDDAFWAANPPLVPYTFRSRHSAALSAVPVLVISPGERLVREVGQPSFRGPDARSRLAASLLHTFANCSRTSGRDTGQLQDDLRRPGRLGFADGASVQAFRRSLLWPMSAA